MVLAASLLLLLVAGVARGQTDGSYDRRLYYSQPMGYSVWKRPPASIEAFARMVEQNQLNATSRQYAQSLSDAGWIAKPDVPSALVFIRSLRQAPAGEGKAYRMGRILRSYRSHEGKLDSNFWQRMKVGEPAYVDPQGNVAIRVLCLNVVYPDRKVSVLPAHEERPRAEPPAPPPMAPAAAPQPPPSDPATEFHFNPPPEFPPPAREAQEPASRSRP